MQIKIQIFYDLAKKHNISTEGWDAEPDTRYEYLGVRPTDIPEGLLGVVLNEEPSAIHPGDIKVARVWVAEEPTKLQVDTFPEAQTVFKRDNKKWLYYMGTERRYCRIEGVYYNSMFGSSYVSIKYYYGDLECEDYVHFKWVEGPPSTAQEKIAECLGWTFCADESNYLKEIQHLKEVQESWQSKQVLIEGPVYVSSPWSGKPVRQMLPGGKHRAIVDAKVQVEGGIWFEQSDLDTRGVFGWVRVFLLVQKEFVYVPVSRVQLYEYNKSAFEGIVLPEQTANLLRKIFLTQEEDRFGDLFDHRHGGTIVLASGPPGVGKTLTAECLAEMTSRPLYCMDVAEIGTSAEKVETSLREIFARATLWNALILLDEADIFLTKRDMSIDRNATVGTFLKFLDHFQGTLFLTTNRVNTIDPAFSSRMTAHIPYPALSIADQVQIWTKMLQRANLEFNEPSILDFAQAQGFNGRQIRNMVRLIKMVQPDTKVTRQSLEGLQKYILQLEEVW